jgi:hypothetical protein
MSIGDIIAESLLIYFPLVLFGKNMYGAWLIDFMLAFVIGILFQYYSIKPMKKSLSAKEILVAALKGRYAFTYLLANRYVWLDGLCILYNL